jgi:hypothetical protein
MRTKILNSAVRCKVQCTNFSKVRYEVSLILILERVHIYLSSCSFFFMYSKPTKERSPLLWDCDILHNASQNLTQQFFPQNQICSKIYRIIRVYAYINTTCRDTSNKEELT